MACAQPSSAPQVALGSLAFVAGAAAGTVFPSDSGATMWAAAGYEGLFLAFTLLFIRLHKRENLAIP